MANLLNQNIGTNYKGILNLNTLNGNLSGTLQEVTDGDGNASPLNLATGSIRFGGTTGLFWDNANNRLGVGTSSPTRTLTISGDGARIKDLNIGVTSGTAIGNTSNIIMNVGSVGFGFRSGGALAATAMVHVLGDGTNPILRLQTSASADAFVFRDTTQLQFGSQSNYISSTANGTTSSGAGRGLLFVGQSGQTIHQFNFISSNSEGSGTIGGINLTGAYVVTTGNAAYQPLRIAYTINATGSTSGSVATGIFLNATETSITGTTHNLMDLQVGGSVIFKVSNNGAVEINSTTQGFLPPRMTTTEVNAIATPAAGLVVYSTTENALCLYNGSSWRKLNDSPL
jgi:hypothetical protein